MRNRRCMNCGWRRAVVGFISGWMVKVSGADTRSGDEFFALLSACASEQSKPGLTF